MRVSRKDSGVKLLSLLQMTRYFGFFSFLVFITYLKSFLCLPLPSLCVVLLFTFICMCGKCVSGNVHGVNGIGVKVFVVFVS